MRVRAPAPQVIRGVGRAMIDALAGDVPLSAKGLRISGPVGLAGALLVLGFVLFVASGPGICGPTSTLGEFLMPAGLLSMFAAGLVTIGWVIVSVASWVMRVLRP